MAVQFCFQSIFKLYLGVETVSWRLLQRMAGMDADWNFKKYAMPAKIAKEIIFVNIFFMTLQEHFVYW